MSLFVFVFRIYSENEYFVLQYIGIIIITNVDINDLKDTWKQHNNCTSIETQIIERHRDLHG